MNNFKNDVTDMLYEVSNKYPKSHSLAIAVFSIGQRMVPMLCINEELVPFNIEDCNFVKQHKFNEIKDLEEVYLFETSAINEAFWKGAPDVVNHGTLIWKNEKRRKMMLEELSNKKDQLSRLKDEIRKLEEYLNK